MPVPDRRTSGVTYNAAAAARAVDIASYGFYDWLRLADLTVAPTWRVTSVGARHECNNEAIPCLVPGSELTLKRCL